MDSAEDEYAAFHFSTASNPLIAAAELESIRRRATEHIWRVEYLAHFSDESGSVFRGFAKLLQPLRQPRACRRAQLYRWHRLGAQSRFHRHRHP